MYIKRSIEQEMLKWKNTEDHGVLEVRGARQVGKTTTIEHFCKENYRNVLYISMTAKSGEWFLQIVDSFGHFHHVPTTLDFLTEYAKRFGIEFTNDSDTVVVFDEIQESQKAYEMIRPFHRELNCDVIVTGSYINKAIKYFQPAGDIDIMTMYPISFPEFISQFDAFSHFENWDNSVLNQNELNWLQKAYNIYCEIGGYPLAVVTFFRNGMQGVDAIHAQIFAMLQEELRNRVDIYDYQKLQAVLNSIINVLLREKKGNSRLVSSLSKITGNINSFRISERECYTAIVWLKEAGILCYCNKLDLVSGKMFNNERIFFQDLGLLTHLCKKYKVPESDTNGIRNETFVFKSLIERNFEKEFYDDGPVFAVIREYELDFFVRSRDDHDYGIEVKTGKNVGKSLRHAQQNGKIDYAVYFKGDCNYGIDGRTVTVPLPLAYNFQYCFDKKTVTKNFATVQDLQAFK